MGRKSYMLKITKYFVMGVFIFISLNVLLSVIPLTNQAELTKTSQIQQENHNIVKENLHGNSDVLYVKVKELAELVVEIQHEADKDDKIRKLAEYSLNKITEILNTLKPGLDTVDSLNTIQPKPGETTKTIQNPNQDYFHNNKDNIHTYSNEQGVFKKTNDMVQNKNPDNYILSEVDPDKLYTVCPEKYTSRAYFDLRYDLYPNLFEKLPCRHSPKSLLVTMVMNLASYPNKEMIQTVERISQGMVQYFPDIPVKIAIRKTHTQPTKSHKQFEFISYSSHQADIWNDLILRVDTPNVLVARNIDLITDDIALDRLIREIDDLDVPIIGGALRTPDGHWNMGCQQTVFKNYTVSYKSGYKQSKHDCIYCDHIQGSFLAKTSFLKKIKFHTGMRNSPGLFETLFLDTKLLSDRRLAVCPDSMFHTRHTKIHKRKDWIPFAAYWGINKLNLPDGVSFHFTCQESNTVKETEIGMATPPCQLQELADAIKTVMSICNENKIILEITAGTLLGAVKFNKILPWELDADMIFLTNQIEAFSQLSEEFENAGYIFDIRQNTSNIWDSYIIDIYTYFWHIEIFGHPRMQSDEMLQKRQIPTKVLLDGQWVNAPTNPGANVRNYAWPEIYRHAQHLFDVGAMSQFELYDTSKFTPCPKPGNMNCLDQYNTDGSLQFEQINF
ncbi:unnamed protein product [Owenia fusiformis]|uniref:LicD/FKTN/FKRP nucleotidyltransferase domain-containing protein n=1 Tax=Owenia fusiformis TaxID=6347 RepID=A0A8J1TJS3_OWEFU|nr:unnamed protein product [Owenia fusiformis]